jgi:hypothetical protein
VRRKFAVIAVTCALAACALLAGAGISAATVKPDTYTGPRGCIVLGQYRALEHVYLDAADGPACPKGTVTYDIGGTAGPQGPAGPKGPRGLAGPSTAGSAGLDVTEVSANTVTAPGNDSVIVACPGSHPYAIGGGADNDGSAVALTGSYPFDSEGPGTPANEWIATVPVSTSGTDLTVFALCAR